jgi:hypothetical protein
MMINNSIYITSGGNVLIGTTTDNGAKLQTVGGSVSFTGVNDGTAIFARRTGGANVFALNVNLDSSWTMYDYASGSYLTGITQKNGNVGIGVSPSAWDTGNTVRAVEISQGALWGYGTTNVYLASNYYWSGSNRIYLKTAAAAEYSITNGAHEWYSASSGTAGTAVTLTPRMTITSGGDINVSGGAVRADGGYFVLRTTSGTTTGLFIRKASWFGTGSDHTPSIAAETGFGINFYTNGTASERMVITSGGNVLIGTTTDGGQKLQVSAGNTSESSAHLNLINSGIYSGFHFLDGTAYYIGQNSNFRSLRMYSGGSSGTGVNLAAGATSWGTYSDERLKDNIENIGYVLPKLLSLRTVKYHLKNVDNEDSKKRLGLIAQDLLGNFDEVLSKSRYSDKDETEYYDVRYQELIPVLIKAIQELKSELDELKSNN